MAKIKETRELSRDGIQAEKKLPLGRYENGLILCKLSDMSDLYKHCLLF